MEWVRKTYNLLILEMVINVAIALELRDGRPPGRRIRISAREITRNIPTGKEPDIDITTGPLSGIDATADGVETIAVGLLILILNAAASIAALAGITIAVAETAGESAIVGDTAALGGVQGHGVVDVVVDAFDYVDFASMRLHKSVARLYDWRQSNYMGCMARFYKE